MARGYPGQFGRAVNAPWVWIGLCVLFAAAVRAPAAAAAAPRPRGAAGLLGLLRVLRRGGPRRLGAERLPAARLPARAHGDRRPAPARAAAAAARRARLPAARDRVPGRVPGRAQRRRRQRDRRRLRERDRRRPARRRRRRSTAPSRPTTRTATPTGRSPTRPTCRSSCCCRGRAGRWDDLPAAHAAAVAFDLGCAALLWLLGRRLRDGALGLLLAYLWLAFPFTLMVANSGANDALVALLVLAALLAAARPAARGALVALAGLTKFAPLALAPLFAAYRPRRLDATRAAFAAVVVARARAVRPLACCGTARSASRRSATRRSRSGASTTLPDGLQLAAQLLAAALRGRRSRSCGPRDVPALAALAAAVLIALQLAVDHWFYLYLVWFAPLVWSRCSRAARRICSIESARRGCRRSGSAPR